MTESRTTYASLVDKFVALHAGRPRQRSEAWLEGKATTIGGSELASLMGWNPYSSYLKVVAAKAGVAPREGYSVPCWWGTLFESAIERYVEIDCGTRLAGTDISVPAPALSGLRGLHANSPDGYCVLSLYQDAEGGWRVQTTDAAAADAAAAAAAAGRPAVTAIALVEFKCPYRRRPDGRVPRHYLPQVWSGLALTPAAHFGLFVDAVFRKCSLESLGPRPGYDRGYHRERDCAEWGAPVAWGFTAVYAPRLDAPRDAAGAADAADVADADAAAADASGAASGDDAAYEAWLLHYKYFGTPYESAEKAARAGRPFGPDMIDFGDCAPALFDKMLEHLDAGRFTAEHVGPCLADGRGAPLTTDRDIGRAVDRAAAAPRHRYLLGIIPWKMLEVDYVAVERRPGFLEEVRPLVASCLGLAAEIRGAADPREAYSAHLARLAEALPGPKSDTVDEAAIQDLFDSI